jgi:hypothetical protein
MMTIGSWVNKLREAAGLAGGATPITAPTLEGATRFPYGPFRFKARLPKGTPYVVETSPDLRTWSLLVKEITNTETIECVDSEAFKFSYRFYRLLAGLVQSTNVIGYAAVTVPPGFSMISNPLDAPSNNVAALFKGWPDGTTLNKFDTRFFKLAENAVKGGKWSNTAERVQPGEGAIFFNPASDYKVLNFVGNVRQGNLSIPIPSGFSVRSSMVPQPGSLEDLGFPIANGDVIHLFDRDRQQYVLHPYKEGKWTAGPPIVSVGESFWVAKAQPGNWTRKFVIGQGS